MLAVGRGGRRIVNRLRRRGDAAPVQLQSVHVKLPNGSVAIPAESHKTRLLERKMEILFLLVGRLCHLENTCSFLAIFNSRNCPVRKIKT